MGSEPQRGLSLGVIADHGGVGFGHLGRCLAVAQEWVSTGGIVRFHSAGPLPDDWMVRLEQAGASSAPMTAIDGPGADAWLLDGYRFNRDLQSHLRGAGVLAVVDDHGSVGRYDADLIIDQNLGAVPGDYRDARGEPQLLLGLDYALLRQEVLAVRPPRAPIRSGRPRQLLVALGGQPTESVRALLEPVAEEAHRWGLAIDRLVGVSDVGAHLAAADLAVAAAGSTCWDLCALGIPAVVIAVSDNQRPVARRLGEVGAAVDAGDLEDITAQELTSALRALYDSAPQRELQARVGWHLVDGQGAARVVAAIRARVER